MVADLWWIPMNSGSGRYLMLAAQHLMMADTQFQVRILRQ